MQYKTLTLAALLAGATAAEAVADDREAVLVNRNTTLNLIEALVKKGILDRDSADAMIRDARQKAEREAKAELEKEAESARASARAVAGGAASAAAAGGAAAGGAGGNAAAGTATASLGAAGNQSIHVGYVPEFVKKEIEANVRKQVKADVMNDVKNTARQEKWAFADLLPGWVQRITPYVDARLRLSDEFYGSDNDQTQYSFAAVDWLQVNRQNFNGGLSNALVNNTAYFNITKDRFRINERFRVGLEAQINDAVKVGVRLTTTNIYSPVSTNQNLGNYFATWIVALDRAFLQYDYVDGQGNDWFTFWGGRIANPFLSTEMMYSPMLSMEGLVGTARWRFNQDQSNVAGYRAQNPTGRYGINLGPQTPDTLWATFGVLPLQEVNFSSTDKYLFAAQAGADWLVFDENRLKIGGAYYGYRNVKAIRNSFESNTYDWTAPEFMQKGNSLVAINDATNQTYCQNTNLGSQNICLVGLASNFQIFDVTASFDYAGFAPTHVMVTADYAHNFGFDRATTTNLSGNPDAGSDAYFVRLDVGRPELRRFNDWNVFFSYRYIESDALLDAFNDPIFHQGGTNSKGWTLGAQYAIAANTWLDLRWLSSDQVGGPPMAIDTLNLDLNARF